MCDAFITEKIRQEFTDRRAFIGACLAIGGLSTLPDEAAAIEEPPKTFRRIIDLTHPLNEDFPTYPGKSGFRIEKVLSYARDRMNVNNWHLAEHVGTHFDAPFHFSENGADLVAIPVTSLFAPLVIIDIRNKAENNADAQVTTEDLDAHLKKYGPLPPKCCVVMQSGWSSHVSSKRFRGEANDGLHFPGFHPDATRKILEESQAVGMGVDTLSLDHGPSKEYESHRLWLPTGRWGVECLNLTEPVPERGAYLFAGCPKVNSGTGGPTRVVAFVP